MLGITKSLKAMQAEYEPQTDYGFLGPDSVSWKVWAHPTSYVLGFVRAVTIEHFDPNLAAAVVQSGGVKYRPSTRYGRTLRYFGMQIFGGAEATCKAADVLVKVHSKAIGHDPVTGGEYDANMPSSQLWIHVTAWHSIIKCYEMFGPGRLTPEEEDRYWQECREIAKLQTIDPDTLPTSREQVHRFFEDWRPRLAASEAAQDMIRFILPVDVALPVDMPAWQRLALKPVTDLYRRAVIATYPKYMRDLAGLRQSAAVDAAVVAPMKALNALLNSNLQLRLAMMTWLSPQAVPVAAPAILGIPPKSSKVWGVRGGPGALRLRRPGRGACRLPRQAAGPGLHPGPHAARGRSRGVAEVHRCDGRAPPGEGRLSLFSHLPRAAVAFLRPPSRLLLGMGTGIVLIIVGAIFTFALRTDGSWMNTRVLGLILMLGGLAFIARARVRRRAVVVRDVEDGAEGHHEVIEDRID